MSSLDHPAVAKVAASLTEAGHTAAAEGIKVLPDEVRTAAQAAQALGVEVGAIANSLIFRAVFTDEDAAHEHAERVTPLLVLTSGGHKADTDTLARLTGATRVEKADPDFVKSRTGQVIGGVAPVGHTQPLHTLVDSALRRYDIMWAAAGHAKTVFPTTFTGLVALTAAAVEDVAGNPEGSER